MGFYGRQIKVLRNRVVQKFRDVYNLVQSMDFSKGPPFQKNNKLDKIVNLLIIPETLNNPASQYLCFWYRSHHSHEVLLQSPWRSCCSRLLIRIRTSGNVILWCTRHCLLWSAASSRLHRTVLYFHDGYYIFQTGVVADDEVVFHQMPAKDRHRSEWKIWKQIYCVLHSIAHIIRGGIRAYVHQSHVHQISGKREKER